MCYGLLSFFTILSLDPLISLSGLDLVGFDEQTCLISDYEV